MEIRSEERESAGLQEGPAQVPRIERHTCEMKSLSPELVMVILFLPCQFCRS